MLITTFSVDGYCPHIEEDITIQGKYEILDENTFKYRSFTCPIVENAKMHYYDQCKKYKYLKPCSNPISCPVASKFQTMIVRK